jgi:flagellar protein FliS
MIPNAHQQYQRVQTETASGGQLIVLLYDGCIRFLGRAEQCHADGDLDGFRAMTRRTQLIINELMGSLDQTGDPDMAGNLFNLYVYLNRRIGEADYKRDTNAIPEVIGHLRSLREAWAQAVQAAGSQATTERLTISS